MEAKLDYLIYFILFCGVVFLLGKYSTKNDKNTNKIQEIYYPDIPPPSNIKIIDRLSIVYHDQNGEVTIREISIIKIQENGSNILISAWCGLRGEIRHFRSDRVMNAYSIYTGKEIKNITKYLSILMGR